MKHRLDILVWIMVLFLAAQYVGLFVVNSYIDYGASAEQDTFVAGNLPSIAGSPIERPQVEAVWSPLFLMGGILLGTIILLLVLKFAKPIVWKGWFFLASVLCLYISMFAFTKSFAYAEWTAFGFALVLSVWKIWKPNPIIQNVCEVLMYGGLVAVLFSIVNIPAMIILLILVSIYDAYAVWKSKHMIVLAQSQTKAGIFAGLMIPYGKVNMHASKTVSAKVSSGKTIKVPQPSKKGEVKIAILGGGDIAFPLLFAAAVLKTYALTGQGWLALVIPPFVALALLGLQLYGKKDTFYPAMPFLSAGCFVGLAVVWLLH
ncbi:MAG: presenilin family intramembrane aspartyl protease [Nanoarchaeota archaeon]